MTRKSNAGRRPKADASPGYHIHQPQYKVCPKCRIRKPRSKYHRDASKKDGLSYLCAQCKRDNANRWRLKNAERVAAANVWSYVKCHKRNMIRKKSKWMLPARGPCAVYGCDALGEHHHLDYEDWRSVIFLCRKHHAAFHRLERLMRKLAERLGIDPDDS